MIYIDLDDARVPALGFGTYRLEGRAARDGVAHALDLGYRHVDTAQVYGNETEVGQGLRDAETDRDAVFLTTKVWPDQFAYRKLIASTDESLRRLGTDYVDLLLLHWPNDDVELAETLDALQEVQHQGKARHIGVSNFTPSLLRRALEIAPGLACLQVEYHPLLDQSTLLEIVREHGLFLTAYTPIARNRVADEDTIRAIAEAHGKSPAQVTLRWHLQQPRVAAIPKAASAAHREANLDVFDFELSDEEMERIHGLAREDGRMIDPNFAPEWGS
jgi:diketogulonate reductase-like aldo/keto reductase